MAGTDSRSQRHEGAEMACSRLSLGMGTALLRSGVSVPHYTWDRPWDLALSVFLPLAPMLCSRALPPGSSKDMLSAVVHGLSNLQVPVGLASC